MALIAIWVLKSFHCTYKSVDLEATLSAKSEGRQALVQALKPAFFTVHTLP